MTWRGSRQSGVTLIEMAMVLLILGVLTRMAVQPMTAAVAQRQWRQATQELESVRHAVWAHVVRRGVLPCPVGLHQTMTEQAAEQCRIGDGGVPAASLGLTGQIDENNALLDPWGRPYRLAISGAAGDARQPPLDWTVPGASSRIGLQNLTADLTICTDAVASLCPDALSRASDVAFVLFSTGPDASVHGAQQENLDGDQVFVLQPRSISASTPFDDLLVWGSASETVYWLLRAGWLP